MVSLQAVPKDWRLPTCGPSKTRESSRLTSKTFWSRAHVSHMSKSPKRSKWKTRFTLGESSAMRSKLFKSIQDKIKLFLLKNVAALNTGGASVPLQIDKHWLRWSSSVNSAAAASQILHFADFVHLSKSSSLYELQQFIFMKDSPKQPLIWPLMTGPRLQHFVFELPATTRPEDFGCSSATARLGGVLSLLGSKTSSLGGLSLLGSCKTSSTFSEME